MTAAARIAAALAALGVRRGGVLLVHSSLSSLGHVPGGADTVLDGLRSALGPDGTLLLPALSYATVHADNPHFDRATTPSCVGAVAESFRRRAGVLRSGSPTHSVCAEGPLAAALVADHHLDTTPVGPRSPLRRLPDPDGQLLFLGCGLRPNTSMHGVEELVEPPYLFAGEVDYSVQLGDERHRVTCRRHGFAGWTQRYDRLERYLPQGAWRRGAVLEATAILLQARPMWESAEAVLRRDPLAFVSPRTAG